MYTLTTATTKLLKLKKRIRAVAGGTSAGKTISILQILIDDAQTDKKPTITSVVSESFPHLRKGAMRDFLSIMQEHGYFKDEAWSKTDSTYTFESGSKIEFFSTDQPGKVRGPRRDRLFANEVNNIPQETFEQLLLRTREYAFADWNPVSEFFMYTDYIDKRKDMDFIVLTYLDNEALDASIVSEIESRKDNKQFWQVYGLGLLGEAEGRVYTGWQIIDEIPHEARLERYGLDFGYSNDPSAIVAIYYHNGGYILDEITYQKGLSNKQLADILKNQPLSLVVADSAEPKSIDELKLYGVNVIPVTKGRDSVVQGIAYVKDQRISITKRSVNGIKEYRNYLWQTDKDGRILNVPIDLWNHFLDATRYGFEGLRSTSQVVHAYKPANMVRAKRSTG
jgi:phage terminase large subunit